MRNTESASFLAGGGELGALMRAFDWTATPLGVPESWPQSLKTAVRIMLTSRQPIWIGWGEELIYLYNDPYKSIIGGKHPWALGQPTRAVWKEIWPEIEPLLAKAMQGDEGIYVEDQLLIMERNGYREETYYTFSYSPIPDDDGSAGGIICANTDYTQRVIGERQISLLRELAATTIDARTPAEACRRAAESLATDARDLPFALVYLTDEGGTLRLAATAGIAAGHPGAPTLVGAHDTTPWALGEAMRSGEFQLVTDPGAELDEPLPSGAWDVPAARAAIIPIRGPDENASAGALVVGLNPFRLLDGNYRGFLALVAGQIGTGIARAGAYESERRRAEALSQIDRAKTAFFSNVSHEFRTPLTLMLGPLEDALIEGGGMPPKQRERLDIAHRNALRLQRLVNSLLDYSRVESGRAKAVFRSTDLGPLTRDLVSSFRAATDRAGLVLNVDVPSLGQPAFVDSHMWETIVLNLMSNAFKFTLEGEIQVRLTEGADNIILSIADTGIGIPSAELPKLFERFHRVEGASGRSYEGSGIGLALVRDLVTLHGGEIDVESEPGRGTIFTVQLPLGQAHLPAEQIRNDTGDMASGSRAASFVQEALRWIPGQDAADADVEVVHDVVPTADEATHALAAHRVLLADDNADLRDYIARLLRQRGHMVEAVPDGAAALAAIRHMKPDLLITDVMMPRLDGMGLLRAIRRDPALQDLSVIVLSARSGEEARVEGLDAGADDYLAKPFSARELIARVDSFLAMTRLRRSATVALRDEARMLEALNRTGASLAGQLDLERVVQMVTDTGVDLTGAQFGAFFYNVKNEDGESYTLYTLSGVERSAFARFPMPRNTAVFAHTFEGRGVMRSDDITRDPRYGRNPPYHGMPEGHLPVRSYLAVSVMSRAGEVIGGLFFGHPETARFTERHERLMSGIAGQAAVAIDNARLYQAAQREINQRTAAEQALQELNEQLEERVVTEIGVRRKAEAALQQAQKMEAIGQLTGGVAHDFNNLLQVISGNLQLLSRDVAGNERAELRVQNALTGVSRGSKLASQLLAFGRRQPLEPKVVNIGRFIRGLDDLLRRALGEEIEIETTVSGGLWNTFADPGQIENALLNLAINARDAMNGRGRLTIEVGNAFLDDEYAASHTEVSPGQYVLLAVTDTGTGIAPDIIDKVFEPFFTTKVEGRGTGLGLSMVYGFARQSGGHVKIYSELGHGTTIKLYLPRSSASEDLVVEAVQQPVLGGSETILVVEDDEQVRVTAVEMLTDLGYSVLKAPDAASALAVVESGVPIDLLFTDVVMPGPLRSPELARRARERLPGIAVLFTSGYTENAIVHGGRLDEGVNLLPKPYTREALSRKIRHVMANQRQVNATSTPQVRVLPAANAPGPATAARPLSILLVEDEEIILLGSMDMLQEMGHEVLGAMNAEEAQRLLSGQSFDVLITDIHLGGRSGIELANEARAMRPQIDVIFATGRDQLPGENAGALLLRKPYDMDGLARCLQKLEKSRE
jgi:signal transduction histidine kinase/DNA-binding response OmpR family regulator